MTILISYLLMFVYIMFFLGHIRSLRTLLVSERESEKLCTSKTLDSF